MKRSPNTRTSHGPAISYRRSTTSSSTRSSFHSCLVRELRICSFVYIQLGLCPSYRAPSNTHIYSAYLSIQNEGRFNAPLSIEELLLGHSHRNLSSNSTHILTLSTLFHHSISSNHVVPTQACCLVHCRYACQYSLSPCFPILTNIYPSRTAKKCPTSVKS